MNWSRGWQATLKHRRVKLDWLGKVHLIGQRGDEDIEGGLRKFLDTRKGGSEKIREAPENLLYSKPTGGGS